jgi:transcriptional regulator with XRE-family HTH domain
MKFFVSFRYKSYYENEKENKIVENHTLEYLANDLNELWDILGEEDYDDEIVLNFDAKSDFISTERDEIKITDQFDKVLWHENNT